MKKADIIILSVILSLGFVLRLYKISRPIADWHSWRQADTAAVTRRYYQEGIDLLHPKYTDLSSIPSGRNNLEGYRMVEFPFINALTAMLYHFFSQFVTLETFSRLVSAIFSLGSTALIYSLARHLYSRLTATVSAFTFAVLPYNLFYSTAILPEVPLVFFLMLSVVLWLYYSQHQQLRFLILFTLSFALALLLKPTAALIVPALLYYYFRHHRHSSLFSPSQSLILFSFTPLLFWRYWIQQFPEGIPAYSWLFNSTQIRFTGAFFRWIFAERFGKLILGYWGTFLFGLGLITKPIKKAGWIIHLWLIGVIIYLFVFATGNVTHDYYQIITIPVIAIFVGLGITTLIRTKTIFSPLPKYLLAFASYTFMLAFSWFHIRDFYNINNPTIVVAGQTADQLLPANARVIAPYGGDTAFLYQTNRQGWPIGGNLSEKISQGATHYISVNLDDETKYLLDNCPLLYQDDSFSIIQLTGCHLD